MNSSRPSSHAKQLSYRLARCIKAKGIITMNAATKAISLLSSFIILQNPLRAADWLQQGGPNRNAIVPADVAGKLATSFPDQKIPLLWKATVGLGIAPVVVSTGKIYTYGLYKHGTPVEKLNDPSFMPEGDVTINIRWIIEKLALKNNMKTPLCYPEILKNPELEKQLPSELQRHLLMLRDMPGVPEWLGRLDADGGPTYNHDDVCPFYRCDEYALCLDAATGRIIWATKLTDYGLAGNILFSVSSPAITDGKIVFRDNGGHIYCLNVADGKILWTVNLWDYKMVCVTADSGALIANDTVIVAYAGLRDVDYKALKDGTLLHWQIDHKAMPVMAGFDLKSGKLKWICKPDCPFEATGIMGSYGVWNARLGYAVIEGNPTVLLCAASGVYGVDPATGTKRWEFNLENKSDATHRGFWAVYHAYAPVAWNNYIIGSISNAHDDYCSQTYCIKIVDNQPTLVWTTDQFVPYIEGPWKSNLLVRDGKVYGFDAHGIWDAQREQEKQQGKKNNTPGRPIRPEGLGHFQCRDVASGKVLWSSDAMQWNFNDPKDQRKITREWYPTQSILIGDLFIPYSSTGLWIARLKENGWEVLAHDDGGFSGGEIASTAVVSEPVLVDGLLYVRKLYSKGEGTLRCYDLRLKK